MEPTKVIRYIRPYVIGSTGEVCPAGNYGVVLVFLIDQEKDQLQLKWSVCNGDTFSKKRGLEEAEKNPVLTLPVYDRTISLYENLVKYIITELSKDSYPTTLRSIQREYRPLVGAVINCRVF